MITDVVVEAIRQTSIWSWIATISAIIYIIGASRVKVWCWPAGIASSGAAMVEYYQQDFPAESVLNGIYVILGFVGWYMWKMHDEANKSNFEVRTLAGRQLQFLLCIGVAGGLVLGFISATYSWSIYPYTDSMLASSSIVATWLTTKRYIENWFFWIIIDGVSVALYLRKGPEMYLFAILFFIFTILSVLGLISWKRQRSNA